MYRCYDILWYWQHNGGRSNSCHSPLQFQQQQHLFISEPETNVDSEVSDTTSQYSLELNNPNKVSMAKVDSCNFEFKAANAYSKMRPLMINNSINEISVLDSRIAIIEQTRDPPSDESPDSDSSCGSLSILLSFLPSFYDGSDRFQLTQVKQPKWQFCINETYYLPLCFHFTQMSTTKSNKKDEKKGWKADKRQMPKASWN